MELVLVSCPQCANGARVHADGAEPAQCPRCDAPLSPRGGVPARFPAGPCFVRPAPLGWRIARELSWAVATVVPWTVLGLLLVKLHLAAALAARGWGTRAFLLDPYPFEDQAWVANLVALLAAVPLLARRWRERQRLRLAAAGERAHLIGPRLGLLAGALVCGLLLWSYGPALALQARRIAPAGLPETAWLGTLLAFGVVAVWLPLGLHLGLVRWLGGRYGVCELWGGRVACDALDGRGARAARLDQLGPRALTAEGVRLELPGLTTLLPAATEEARAAALRALDDADAAVASAGGEVTALTTIPTPSWPRARRAAFLVLGAAPAAYAGATLGLAWVAPALAVMTWLVTPGELWLRSQRSQRAREVSLLLAALVALALCWRPPLPPRQLPLTDALGNELLLVSALNDWDRLLVLGAHALPAGLEAEERVVAIQGGTLVERAVDPARVARWLWLREVGGLAKSPLYELLCGVRHPVVRRFVDGFTGRGTGFVSGMVDGQPQTLEWTAEAGQVITLFCRPELQTASYHAPAWAWHSISVAPTTCDFAGSLQFPDALPALASLISLRERVGSGVALQQAAGPMVPFWRTVARPPHSRGGLRALAVWYSGFSNEELLRALGRPSDPGTLHIHEVVERDPRSGAVSVGYGRFQRPEDHRASAAETRTWLALQGFDRLVEPFLRERLRSPDADERRSGLLGLCQLLQPLEDDSWSLVLDALQRARVPDPSGWRLEETYVALFCLERAIEPPWDRSPLGLARWALRRPGALARARELADDEAYPPPIRSRAKELLGDAR